MKAYFIFIIINTKNQIKKTSKMIKDKNKFDIKHKDLKKVYFTPSHTSILSIYKV